MGIPVWTRETLTSSLLPRPDSTVSVSSPPPPYARARSVDASVGPRARGRGDDGRGSRMDAGDADVEDVVVALDDGERVLARAALRVREASTRASGRARADEATTDGDPGRTRETLTVRWLEWPLTTIASLPPFPYAPR